MKEAKQAAIIDAAFEVAKFSKENPYPKEMSPEFFNLTDLMHSLEVAFIEAGYDMDFSTQAKGLK